jgi:hypothetical protein
MSSGSSTIVSLSLDKVYHLLALINLGLTLTNNMLVNNFQASRIRALWIIQKRSLYLFNYRHHYTMREDSNLAALRLISSGPGGPGGGANSGCS